MAKVPLSFNPSAFAACTVAPCSACSGVILKCVQASAIANRTDSSGAVPGLQSLAMAMATPCCSNKAIGGSLVSRNTWNAPGNNTATVPCSAIFKTDASLLYSTWSADKPENSAVKPAPDKSLSWSAWHFTGKPQSPAASNTRRVCVAEKPIPSQNTSTASINFSLCKIGIHSQTAVMYSSARPTNSGGSACAAR